MLLIWGVKKVGVGHKAGGKLSIEGVRFKPSSHCDGKLQGLMTHNYENYERTISKVLFLYEHVCSAISTSGVSFAFKFGL